LVRCPGRRGARVPRARRAPPRPPVVAGGTGGGALGRVADQLNQTVLMAW